MCPAAILAMQPASQPQPKTSGIGLGVNKQSVAYVYTDFQENKYRDGYYFYHEQSAGYGTRYYSSKRFGYYLFGSVGYRYQRPRGFVFRVGVNPSFNFDGSHGVGALSLHEFWLCFLNYSKPSTKTLAI